MRKINLADKFSLFSEHWTPKIIGELNDSCVKIAKFHGEFTCHKHDNEDELLHVIRGSMVVQFRGENIEVGEGEFIIIPKGVEHCPKADSEAWVLLIEPKTTLNTGDVVNDMTVENPEFI